MNRKNIFLFVLAVIIIGGMIAFRIRTSSSRRGSPTTETTVRFVSSAITVDGSVTAQDKATLNFQTPGKLTYLPLKEGDKVYAGQTIAQLDTYQLQRQLASALNTYRSTRDTFDQTQVNSQNNVLKAGQQSTYSKVNTYPDSAINDAVKRIADQNQATLDNSVITVELANYALQLSRLTSPLNGIITHEDVTVPGVNVTTLTSFTVADPNSMVFRANIPTENIYYISEGGTVTIALDGIQKKISGTIIKIYPSKSVLPSGESVYQVDIASDDLKKLARLDQAGTAIIETNAHNVALVPAWTVLGGKYVWVDNNGIPELRQVTAGKVHGNEIEITGGLSPNDKIIIDPKLIPSRVYQLL